MMGFFFFNITHSLLFYFCPQRLKLHEDMDMDTADRTNSQITSIQILVFILKLAFNVNQNFYLLVYCMFVLIQLFQLLHTSEKEHE